MASASTPTVNEPTKDYFCPLNKAKSKLKAQISGKLVTNGVSDVATASVHSEKTRLKKLMIYDNFMNLSQETSVLGGCQKWTSIYETEVRN